MVPESEGRLFRVDLYALGIPPKVFDRLAELGSGRVPVPEPYFHEVLKETKYWPAGNYKNGKPYAAGNYTTTKIVHARGLPELETGVLVAECQTQFPILRADWFRYYSLQEPRYHELIGLNIDDVKLADFEKLAAVDVKIADREGAIVRGQVFFSDVAEHNRGLERTPTILAYGKGYYWKSFDFDKSIDGSDLFVDPLNEKVAANELIFTLRNKLQGYGIVDGAGKRLDRAAINVARDKRTPLSSPEVEIRNCFGCHAKGIIPIEDEVRLTAGDHIRLDVLQLDKRSAATTKRIQDRYFSTALEPLIYADQEQYEQAVRACNGLAAAANAMQLQAFLVDYEKPLTIEALAMETGYPVVTVRGVIERSAGTGLDPHIAATAQARPRRVRRDQLEATGFSSLMGLLSQLPTEK